MGDFAVNILDVLVRLGSVEQRTSSLEAENQALKEKIATLEARLNGPGTVLRDHQLGATEKADGEPAPKPVSNNSRTSNALDSTNGRLFSLEQVVVPTVLKADQYARVYRVRVTRDGAHDGFLFIARDALQLLGMEWSCRDDMPKDVLKKVSPFWCSLHRLHPHLVPGACIQTNYYARFCRLRTLS